MINSLFQNGGVYIIIASFAGLGLVFRMLEVLSFKSMVSKKSKKDQKGKKQSSAFLTYLKTDYTKKYLTGKKVNNVEAYVDKQMMTKKFCKMSLATCNKMCKLMMVLTSTVIAIIGVLGMLNRRRDEEVLSVLLVGAISIGIMVVADCLISYTDRIRQYKVSIVSHIENEYLYYVSSQAHKDKEKESIKGTVKAKELHHEEMEKPEDEKIQETHENQDTVSTLASRQKKILLEEKENKAARRDINEEKVLEVDDAYANDDKKMVDEIIKGLFAG